MSIFSKEIFSPDHPLANIHGMVGRNGETTCKTGNGRMCTGCCEALHIQDLDPDGIGVLKEAGQKCEAQIAGEGCRHVLEGNPEQRYSICDPYHCSGDLRRLADPTTSWEERIAASQRLVMENAAAPQNGEIGRKTYNANLNRIPTP